MLQFSGTLRNATVRISPMSSWRMSGQQLLAACSGAVNLNPVLVQEKEDIQTPSTEKLRQPKKEIIASNNPMVQAVFNTLKRNKNGPVPKKEMDLNINTDQITVNIDGLLKIVDEQILTNNTALAMITLLLDWVNKGKAKLSDFENDVRFLTLCKIFLKSEKSKVSETMKPKIKHFNPYHLFYESTGVAEIIKLDPNITVRQMIQVMKTLAIQKRRSTPLLRTLCSSINASSEEIEIRQISDLLYAMASLNYPDEALLKKISNDLIPCVKKVEHSAVIGSILTSLGIIRYKNPSLLDELSEWTVTHVNIMRSIDIRSLFMTLAMVGHIPSNVENLTKGVIKPLKETDMTGSSDWLNLVWALTVLGLAENRHISSVLHSDFVGRMKDFSEKSMAQRYKLLNINGAAKLLMKNYEGPLLESDSDIVQSMIVTSNEKKEYAKSVVEVLERNFPSPEFLQTNVDVGIGILLDAELCVDSNGHRLPINTEFNNSCRGSRIAMFFLTYNDFCRGETDVLGFHKLYRRMLETKGYNVIYIPFTDFTAYDKISQRIEYIAGRIKNAVN